MCGLAGFFLSNKSTDRNKLIKNLNEMTSALIHRGPDTQTGKDYGHLLGQFSQMPIILDATYLD